jgi:hypothetical protein
MRRAIEDIGGEPLAGSGFENEKPEEVFSGKVLLPSTSSGEHRLNTVKKSARPDFRIPVFSIARMRSANPLCSLFAIHNQFPKLNVASSELFRQRRVRQAETGGCEQHFHR